MHAPFKVSVPGRVCLFGEHQDYLGLAVIAMAVDRRLEIEARPRADNVYRVQMPDLPDELVLVPSGEITCDRPRDYLRSGINVLKREGLAFGQGWDFTVRSTIPIGAGCASSSALTVAWIAANLYIHGDPRALQPIEIARLAHRAEVAEFGEPGGMMDHYTCSLGGLIHVDCADPVTVTPLEADLPGLVLGHSGAWKDTTAILADVRGGVEGAVAAIRELMPGFDLKTTPLGMAGHHFVALPADQRDRLAASLANRDICQDALMFLRSRPDPRRVGELLSLHHQMLRDKLGVSTDKIEAMIAAAMGVGALGCKLNGSGGGGTMIALAPGKTDEVVAAIKRTGAEAWLIHKAPGVDIQVLL
ncbi:MAG: GHMP kinase [Verrucomicrobia bacterium]|nr:GHMP kinase [Verrucomicrobiota bacterium]